MSVNVPATTILYPDNVDGVLVEVPPGPTIDNIFYFQQGQSVFKRIITGQVRAKEIGVVSTNSANVNTTRLQAALNHTGIQEIIFDTIGGGQISLTGTLSCGGKKLTLTAGNYFGGTCTISNAVVKGEDNAQIFTTDVTLSSVRTCDNIFYVAWYGAKGDNSTDNAVSLQKCADYVSTNTVNVKVLQFGGGTYRISKGIVFYRKAADGLEYEQIQVSIFGVTCAQTATGTFETVLSLTTSDNFAMAIQEGKGCVVRDISFFGTNQLTYSQAQVFDPNSTFILSTQRDNRYSPYAGLVFDPFGNVPDTGNRYPGFTDMYTNTSNGGSTTCIVQNISLNGFVVGIVMGPNGATANNEGHVFDHIWLRKMREGIVTCRSQERTVRCTNINCWDRTQTVFANNVYGSRTGAIPVIDTINIAGSVYQLMDFNGGGGSNLGSFSNFFCESFYRIGRSEGRSNTFTNCTFHFDNTESLSLPAQSYLYYTNKTSFIGCNVFYFTSDTQKRRPMNMVGRIQFLNCLLNNQIGVPYVNNVLYNTPDYDRVDFYSMNGYINKQNLISSAANYTASGQGSTIHYLPFGTEITTMGGGNGPTLSNGWKAKQVRRSLSPLVKRIPLGSLTVTVTGLTATFTVAALANVTAFDGLLVYSNSYTYTANGSSISGGQIMKIVSIDGSGVVSCDRVVDGLTTGSYALFIEVLTTISAPVVANISGTTLSDVTNSSGAATLTNGGLYFVYGNSEIIVTSSSSGSASVAYNNSGEGNLAVLSAFEYDEYGESESDPLSNTLFPNGTLFTKGAFYKKVNGNTGTYGWQCTKTGIKGTSLAPEFVELTTSLP